MRLRSKILLGFLPLLIAAFLLVSGYAYFSQYHAYRERADSELTLTLHNVQVLASQQYDSAHASLELLAANAAVQHYLQQSPMLGDEFSASQLQQDLNRLVKWRADLSELLLLDSEGGILLQALQPGKAPLTALPKAFLDKLNNPTDRIHSTVLHDPASPEAQWLLGSPVFADGEPVGFLVLQLSSDRLRDVLEESRFSYDGFAFLFDQNGLLLGGPEGEPINPALVDEALLLASTAPESLTEVHAAGKNHWIRVLALGDSAYVAGVVPIKQVNAQLFKLMMVILLVTALCACVFGAIMLKLLHRLIIRPIEQLQSASQAIAAGQLDYRVEERREDELGALEHAFENMSMSLQTFALEMQNMAYQDKLTGLPNRRHFQEGLRDAVASAARCDERLALLFIDLDGFKQVNDTYGHEMGDRLLEQVARRLKCCLRQTDQLALTASDRDLLADVLAETDDSQDEPLVRSLARLGGDEFTILLRHLDAGLNAARVAERVLDALDEPIRIGDHQFHIGASIGIACYPDDGTSADELTKHADTAMYEAKSNGKHCYQFFDAKMGLVNARRMELTGELRRALKEQHFELHYQPLVSSLNGQMYGCEALIRWQHPDKGMITPGEFIPVAEEAGLILQVGRWVLFEACHQLRRWQDAGMECGLVSVNISNIQVNQGRLSPLIREALASSGLHPEQLLIELTESSLMQATQDIIDDLQTVRAMGVRVAIDDFGTGYSSLGALKVLPIDVLKIDRSFVDGLSRDEKCDAIVAAILAMGNKLGLKLVAEGIESEEQMHLLSLNGCHFYQGFAISRPLPAEKLQQFADSNYTLEVD